MHTYCKNLAGKKEEYPGSAAQLCQDHALYLLKSTEAGREINSTRQDKGTMCPIRGEERMQNTILCADITFSQLKNPFLT
jgi:hypothetical protein